MLSGIMDRVTEDYTRQVFAFQLSASLRISRRNIDNAGHQSITNTYYNSYRGAPDNIGVTILLTEIW
jgi:hypothetical protein